MSQGPSWLVIGSTGLLGQAIMRQLSKRGLHAVGLARNGADHRVDIIDARALEHALEAVSPNVVVNCAAITDLGACEEDPGKAYGVNARPIAALATYCNLRGSLLAQISTDHFWVGDGAGKHREDAAVKLVNEYARTKYCAEAFAMTASEHLVIRTNITGYRGWSQPTFAEWCLGAIEEDAEINLFRDYHASTLDTEAASVAILDLIARGARGLINVGCSEVSSKLEFVERLAAALGRRLTRARAGSVQNLMPVRANSNGLDVTKAESILGYRLPDADGVAAALISQRHVFLETRRSQ